MMWRKNNWTLYVLCLLFDFMIPCSFRYGSSLYKFDPFCIDFADLSARISSKKHSDWTWQYMTLSALATISAARPYWRFVISLVRHLSIYVDSQAMDRLNLLNEENLDGLKRVPLTASISKLSSDSTFADGQISSFPDNKSGPFHYWWHSNYCLNLVA